MPSRPRAKEAPLATSPDRPLEDPIAGGAEPADAAPPAEACPNCGAGGLAAYCPQCGQRRPAADDYTLRRFWRHLFHEATEIDSSLVHSVLGLFRPGLLTVEHLAGRRARSVSPVKIYLLVSAFYFLFAWDLSFEMTGYAEQMRSQDVTATMPPALAQKYLAGLDGILERSGELTAYLRVVTVLGLGFVLALLYRRARRPLGQHFVFTLHYYSFYLVFALLILIPLLLWRAASGETVPMGVYFVVGYLPMAPYAYLALRRVYGQGRGKTALKTALLMLFDAALWMAIGLLAFGFATFEALRS